MKKRKKLAAAMLGLILGAKTFSCEIYAEDNIISMEEDMTYGIQNLLDQTDCSQGEIVTLAVYLKGSNVSETQEISVMNGILEYDNSLFIIKKADILPAENEKVKTCSFDETSGMFYVEYNSGIVVADGGLLLQLQPHVTDDASTGKTTVCVTNMEWSSFNNQQRVEVEHRVPARLTITKAERNSMEGDVNLDGKVNLTDAKLVMQNYNNIKTLTSQQKVNADVNGDSIINLTDVKLIMRYYNKEINKF